ncbi:glutamate receptor ionotropic, kainate 3 [Caerostris darwini]|uniref:Glutamate receptor ionotropic, kainate 3 n=1 Tax=Caerostris darwini TaxID=1538125 RepID=A0AAV4T1S1_9ARAC|nr:glutamate receptor ionotropic, kainate 3 [Caerostris darwini]
MSILCLHLQKADMAIADLTITYVREEAVDFTMPFMNLGISILFKKPTKKVPKLFSFLSPLSVEVWLYMATAFLDCRIFNVVTDLVPPVRKFDTSCDALMSITYATINELYPESEWLRIYTDGSRVEQQMHARAGIFCDLFSVYSSANLHLLTTGEVDALRIP